MFLLIILIYINTYKAVFFFLFKSGTSTIMFLFFLLFLMRGSHNLLQVGFGSGQPFCLGIDACVPTTSSASVSSLPPHDSAHTWNGGEKKKRQITKNPHKNSNIAFTPHFFLHCFLVQNFADMYCNHPRVSPFQMGYILFYQLIKSIPYPPTPPHPDITFPTICKTVHHIFFYFT